jgi:hypothetical protein
VTVEVHGLGELLADFARAQTRSVDEFAGVVTKGAVNVKTDWRQRWSGIAHAPALSAAVTFDVTFGLGRVEAEIGPDKDKRQGALGNIIEFGTENNAPIPGGLPAAEAERPRFEKALGDIGGRMLEGR